MNRAATIALTPLGLLYGAAMRARASLYERRIFRTHQIGKPVISVGNLTTGGTGKTPLVAAIAQHLAQEGRRVCILTRGYGRENPGRRVVVSDGNQILAGVTETGDEPLMLAEQLKGKAAVICDADRVAAARFAEEELASDVFILDDGFQNLRIARDVNVVTIDATNPWGSKHVLPAGILREPLRALGRADCVVVTRADQAIEAHLLNQIERLSSAPVLSSRMVVSGIRPIQSAEPAQSKTSLTRQPVAAFCAVGNPQGFFHLLRADFDLTSTHPFRDHHQFTQAGIDRVTRDALAAGAKALVTTAKDEVKLRSLRLDLPCYVVDIAIEVSSPDKLFDLIDRAMARRA
ncbi:MAG TPA: tetraacyldisaccharide 4'-kinase [Pyrinomonadaceae bacterium]